MSVGLLTDGTTALILTEDDELWAARMIVGEEGLSATSERTAAIVSTMLRRWTSYSSRRFALGQRPLWPTFTALIRSYSQPIQPTRDTPNAERARTIEWADIPAPIRSTVRGLLRGQIQLTQQDSGAVEFAAPSHVADRMSGGGVPDWELVPSPARNQLVSNTIGRNASEPRIAPGHDDGGAGVGWFLLALAGLGVALGAT